MIVMKLVSLIALAAKQLYLNVWRGAFNNGVYSNVCELGVMPSITSRTLRGSVTTIISP